MLEFIYVVENIDYLKVEELRFKFLGFIKIFGWDWDE